MGNILYAAVDCIMCCYRKCQVKNLWYGRIGAGIQIFSKECHACQNGNYEFFAFYYFYNIDTVCGKEDNFYKYGKQNAASPLYEEKREEKEEEMRLCSYLMLASVENVGLVTFDYESGGKEYSVTITSEEASEYMGRDIKECYQDISLLQQLLEKTDLKFAHKSIRIRAERVTSPAYEKEILRQLKELEQKSGRTLLPREDGQ